MASSDTSHSSSFESVLSGRRVLVTGHTGFTGLWLVLWLRALGCDVTGLALPPDTEPNLFSASGIAGGIESRFGDIRDFETVERVVAAASRGRPIAISAR
jgi:CDP-glucose 4,6-dehydratase